MCDLTSLGTQVMENIKKNSFFVLQGQVTHTDQLEKYVIKRNLLHNHNVLEICFLSFLRGSYYINFVCHLQFLSSIFQLSTHQNSVNCKVSDMEYDGRVLPFALIIRKRKNFTQHSFSLSLNTNTVSSYLLQPWANYSQNLCRNL